MTLCPDQKRGHMGVTTIPPRRFDSCIHPKAASSPPQGDVKRGRSCLALPDVAEDSIYCDISSWSLSSPLIYQSFIYHLRGTRSILGTVLLAGGSAVNKRDTVPGFTQLVTSLPVFFSF